MALILAVLSLVWGTQHLVIRVTQPDVAPALAVALRFAIVALVAECVCRVRGHRIGARHLPLRALFGVMHAVSMVLLYAANGEIPTALVGLLIATTPLFVTLLAPLLLRGGPTTDGTPAAREPFGPTQLAAAVIGVAGIAILSVSELGDGGSIVGIVFGLGAALASALSRVASKALVLPLPSAVLLRDLGAVSALTAAALWLAQGRPGTAPDLTAWAGIAYLGLVASALATGLYLGILRHVPVAKLSYQMLVTALVATLAGTLVRSEPFGPEAALGAVLVLVGLALTVRRHPGRSLREGDAGGYRKR